MKKKKVLIVGAGNVGMRLIGLLRQRMRGSVRVFALVRRPQQRAAVRRASAQALVGDLDHERSLHTLHHERFDALVHLAPPPASGRRDERTRRLLRAIVPKTRASAGRRFALVYVSTTGVYGDCAGARFDESRPVRPQSARALRRVDAERCIGKFARLQGWHASLLRAPGIYDGEHLPLARLRAGTPALAAADDVYSNHVQADDLAAMCVAALRSRRHVRIYHACDDSELRMGEYFDLVADAYGLPRAPRLPRAEIAKRLDPLRMSFLQESRRLANARIKRELGVRLRYPTVVDFLAGNRRSSLPPQR